MVILTCWRADFAGGVLVKIGIVDDHDDSRYLMRCWLESQQHEVQDWGLGEGLLQYLDGHNLHLVLVDLWLPDVDGLTLPEIVRRRHRREIPFVAVTANAMNNAREQAFAAGFRDYLVKPVNLDDLKRVIEEIVLRIT
jgi:two-component system, cell cycle response regulator DivK